jgi:hypothetical protein
MEHPFSRESERILFHTFYSLDVKQGAPTSMPVCPLDVDFANIEIFRQTPSNAKIFLSNALVSCLLALHRSVGVAKNYTGRLSG